MTTPAFTVVGQRVVKRDAFDKVTGAARYAGDISLPRMLHAAVLRSPHAHARIRSIDIAAAQALPGVVAVIHGGNFTAKPYTSSEWDAPVALGALPQDQLIFSPVVRFVGEAVAAVAAADVATARAALDLIQVDYELLPAVFDPEAAMASGAPLVQEAVAGNVAAHLNFPFGNPDAGFAAADQILERRYITSRQKQTPMEPFTCVAHYDGQTLTVWTPTQTPHQNRVKLADMFGLGAASVRIITPTVGGGFGARTGVTGEPWAVALSMVTRRPVRLVYTRYEDFIATEARHPAIVDVKIGHKNDGTLTALYVRSVLNTGPYASQGPGVTAVHGLTAIRPYKCPERAFDGYTVLTNAPPASAFRGYGGPQAVFAIEQAIDEVAASIGKDPLQYRREVLAGPGDLDGMLFTAIENDGLQRCLDAGAQAFGWAGREARREQSRDEWRRGFGLAVVVWVSGTGCLGEALTEASVANVRLCADGTVNLITGAMDCGTGPGTALGQICAEELGVPYSSVQVTMGDTEVTPLDLGAHASRTLFVAGLAARKAAGELKVKSLAIAGDLLEASPQDLETVNGRIQVRGVPDRSVSYGQVAAKAFAAHGELTASGSAPQQQAPPYGVQLAEVEVNMKTGQVRVIRLVAAHDVGTAINPLIVEGQIEGGAAQGIGYALTEDMPCDPHTGQPLQASFMEYRMPTALDLPGIESMIIEAPDPAGPFGAKGIGEPGVIPTAPAIANAIYDAIGVRIRELPMTPERILAAIASGRR